MTSKEPRTGPATKGDVIIGCVLTGLLIIFLTGIIHHTTKRIESMKPCATSGENK